MMGWAMAKKEGTTADVEASGTEGESGEGTAPSEDRTERWLATWDPPLLPVSDGGGEDLQLPMIGSGSMVR